MAREQRRLAAIVSADIAGYSRLMGRDETATLAELKSLRRELIDPAIAAHGGRIVKSTGDGLLVEFASVVDAVNCVVEVQKAMAGRDEAVDDDHRIVFRIGMNLGDIIIDGDDIFGDGVNVAARLQELASPGGLCVSSRVHDDVRPRTWFPGGGLSRHEYRPADPCLACRVARRPAAHDKWALARPTAVDRRAAFREHSDDLEQEYFTDGITEDIITELSRLTNCSSFPPAPSPTRASRLTSTSAAKGVRYVLKAHPQGSQPSG